MEKHISISVTTEKGYARETLTFLTGHSPSGIQISLIDPYQIKDSMESTVFSILPPAETPIRYRIAHGLPSLDRSEKQTLEIHWVDDPKDMIMNDPESLQAFYKEAEEEDRHLAQIGTEHYVELLKQEEENFA